MTNSVVSRSVQGNKSKHQEWIKSIIVPGTHPAPCDEVWSCTDPSVCASPAPGCSVSSVANSRATWCTLVLLLEHHHQVPSSHMKGEHREPTADWLHDGRDLSTRVQETFKTQWGRGWGKTAEIRLIKWCNVISHH